MNKIFVKVFLLTMFGFSLLYGCKTQRTTVKTPEKECSADFLLSKMAENQVHFETVSMKVFISARLNGSKSSMELNGTVRIIRDSVIWISISPGLGLEVARFFITQDSVFFINRLANQYMASDFSYFNANYQIDVDFNMLQSLLLGNDFDYYDYSVFKAGYDNGNYKLTIQERRKQKKYIRNNEDARRVLIQNTWIDPEHYKIVQVQIKAVENQNRKLQATYSQFTKIDNQLFPAKETFEISMQEEGKSNYKSSLSISFSKIEFNKEVNTSFSIPNKYTPIKL